MSERVPVAKPSLTTNQRFRVAIQDKRAAGAELSEMVLRLTLRDSANLKRDRDVALEDIAFDDGAMRFLGVRVVEGGTTSSELVEASEEAEKVEGQAKAAQEAEVKAKPKTKAKPKKTKSAVAADEASTTPEAVH